MKTENKTQYIQFILLGLFVSILVASNAGGSKLISFGPIFASATVVSYALSFLVTDIVSEVYGKEIANKFVVVGFFGALVAVLFFILTTILPPAPIYEDQSAFEKVFSLSPRLLVGGFTSFLVSQFLDIRIFHFLKKLTKGKYLWFRNNASTMVSQLVDSIIFITISFYGVIDGLIPLIFGQYLIKLVVAIIDTPLVYLFTGIIKKIERTNGEKVEK
jgi:uncharacterized integral membrane protein (TIGR00697 family)